MHLTLNNTPDVAIPEIALWLVLGILALLIYRCSISLLTPFDPSNDRTTSFDPLGSVGSLALVPLGLISFVLVVLAFVLTAASSEFRVYIEGLFGRPVQPRAVLGTELKD